MCVMLDNTTQAMSVRLLPRLLCLNNCYVKLMSLMIITIICGACVSIKIELASYDADSLTDR